MWLGNTWLKVGEREKDWKNDKLSRVRVKFQFRNVRTLSYSKEKVNENSDSYFLQNSNCAYQASKVNFFKMDEVYLDEELRRN